MTNVTVYYLVASDFSAVFCDNLPRDSHTVCYKESPFSLALTRDVLPETDTVCQSTKYTFSNEAYYLLCQLYSTTSFVVLKATP